MYKIIYRAPLQHVEPGGWYVMQQTEPGRYKPVDGPYSSKQEAEKSPLYLFYKNKN